MNKILIILIAFLLANPVFAEEKASGKKQEKEIKTASVSAVSSLTMNDAIKAALENNNELRAMKNALNADKNDIGIAKSYILPKLRFDEIFISTNMPAADFALRINQGRFTSDDLANAPGSFNNPDPINSFVTAITLVQPIYIKKTYVGLSMSKQEYLSRTYEYYRKQEEVAFNVSKTYLSAISAQEYVKVAQKALIDAKEHLRIAKSRFDTGLGLYSDVLRACTAVSSAEQNLVSANKNFNLSLRALGLLLGQTNSAAINFQAPAFCLKNIDYENTALLSRNDIKFMEARVENAKKGIELAKADYYPSVYGFGSYLFWDHRAPFFGEGNNYIAGAGVSWTAFDGFKRKYETAKAKDKAAEAQEYFEGMKKQVLFQVYESKMNIQEASKRLEFAASACKSAEEGNKLVLKRWENSLSPFVDLLDAQVNLDKTRADVVKANNDYKTALLELSYQSGIIFKDLGLE